MPTIAFASPKGGARKSTSAVILATELARKGAAVVVIDADPNRLVSAWAKRAGKPDRLEVLANVTEETIIDEIEAAATRAPFVLVDLEGTASIRVAYAISRADLVIIPSQGSQLDASEAAKAIKLTASRKKRSVGAFPMPCRSPAPAPPSSRARSSTFGRAHEQRHPSLSDPDARERNLPGNLQLRRHGRGAERGAGEQSGCRRKECQSLRG